MISYVITQLLKETCTKHGIDYNFLLLDVQQYCSKMNWKTRLVIVEVHSMSILTSTDAISRVVGVGNSSIRNIVYPTMAQIKVKRGRQKVKN